MFRLRSSLLAVLLWVAPQWGVAANTNLPNFSSLEGYLACLLINEVAFPGEQGYISEQNSMQAMENILLVLDARIFHVPSPYTRFQIAQTSSDKLLDVITAGGKNGQVQGFYRDAEGYATMDSRIPKRIRYLQGIANQGAPGRFARLLNHGTKLSTSYVAKLRRPENLFVNLRTIDTTPVTGRAYSWMTDRHYYHSGGRFVRIPNKLNGSLGGNRFFTLQDIASQ
ncbi:MAG: hypothetical protein ACPGES_03260 [Coraliomargarita sp.]